MKTQISTVSQILSVAAVLLGSLAGIGLLAGQNTESMKKGDVTVSLARTIGVEFPDSLFGKMKLAQNALPTASLASGPKGGSQSVALASASPRLRADVIPAQVGIESGEIIQTAAEEISDPFIENSVSMEESANSSSDVPATLPTELVLPEESNLPSEISSVDDALSIAESSPAEEIVSTAESTPVDLVVPAEESTSGTEALPVSEESEMVSVGEPAVDSHFLSSTAGQVSLSEPSSLASSEFHSTAGQKVEADSVALSAPLGASAETSLENAVGVASGGLQPVGMSEKDEQLTELKPAVPSLETSGAVVYGKGKPGEARLEGVQSSLLTIEKKAPEEIQVGTVSTWTITVRNEGKTDAVGVEIHDTVPEGARLVNTSPTAQVSRDGEITWNVGTMPAGMMAIVKLELLPVQEGELGSVASVTARSVASAKSRVTRPLLKLETEGLDRVLLGEQTELLITVSNPGTGVARNVVLSETVPPELQFEGGAELLYQVGDLKPGEAKTTKLPLTAVRPGKFMNKVVAKSEPSLQAESAFNMEVTAPALELKLNGPTKRFLDKEGTYSLVLKNTGTASAKNVELKASVPSGWRFERANNLGTFLPEERLTVWKLEELGAGEVAEAEVAFIPTEIGTVTMQCEATADICQGAGDSKTISVEGIAALMFQVVDSNDPIQVGEKTVYSVEVVNQGSKQAENVQVVVDVPAGLQLADGGEGCQILETSKGKRLVFEKIPFLSPKTKKIYRFTLRGASSGDQRVTVGLSSREFPTPIVKEESTRVFAE